MPNTPTMLFGYEADLTLTLKEGDYRLVVLNPWKFDLARGDVKIDLDAILDAIHNSTLRGYRWGDKIAKTADDTESIATAAAYPAGRWQPWITQQASLWVDRYGNVHRIDRMSKRYCLNVIQFLYESHRDDLGDDPSECPLIQALRKRVLS